MDAEVLQEKRKGVFRNTFLRAQVVSLTATGIDFSLSLFLYHIASVYYVTATTMGSVCGAVTSFVLGRNWAFRSKKGKIRMQVVRFLIIQVFSIFFNSTAVYFFKENFQLSFLSSRIIVALIVGVFFNFVMNRYFVFR